MFRKVRPDASATSFGTKCARSHIGVAESVSGSLGLHTASYHAVDLPLSIHRYEQISPVPKGVFWNQNALYYCPRSAGLAYMAEFDRQGLEGFGRQRVWLSVTRRTILTIFWSNFVQNRQVHFFVALVFPRHENHHVSLVLVFSPRLLADCKEDANGTCCLDHRRHHLGVSESHCKVQVD